MELGGGGEGRAAAAAGEDRLSALPDDVIVLILLKLSTSDAARTRVLSHRWRRIWALLPRLWFLKPLEPHRLRDALDGHEVLLRHLLVLADRTNPESLAVWLPAAARRVSGDLTVRTYGPVVGAGEEEAAKRGAVELPCFEQATTISLFLGFQGLAVPLTGVFSRLTELHLSRVWFHGPGELGDVVSSPRCPCLQALVIRDARGLKGLAIHSESMLCIELRGLHTLSQLTVVAPALVALFVSSCFRKSQSATHISAPLLRILEWNDEYDPSSVHLDKMAHLQRLQPHIYFAYGKMGGLLHNRNQSCLSLLQSIEGTRILFLTLVYPPGMENYDYMMENMVALPDITYLRLMMIANGHAFGASAFHVLRSCTGITGLRLDLPVTVSEGQDVCLSDCICAQLVEWATEKLLLNHLEEVEINGWRGTGHEVAFVKRLFDWGTKLKEMTVTFSSSISEVKAKELYQTFQSFSKPGLCMKFYRYENRVSVEDEFAFENHPKVLYAPKV